MSISLRSVSVDLLCFFVWLLFGWFCFVSPVPGNIELVSPYSKKQSPLPFFMNWLHTKPNLHQLLWLEILETSQTFSVVPLLWICMCRLLIKRIC